MKIAALIVPLLFLAGCGPGSDAPPPGGFPPPAAGLRLTVEPQVASSGSSVALILFNGTARPVGYNLCMSALERWQSGSWQTVPEDGVCTAELRTLQPGDQARHPKTLPATLSAGDYRYVTRVESPLNGGPLQRVASDPFAVRP